jgi:RNA polymerase sigma factor (TIGR02999 family)
MVGVHAEVDNADWTDGNRNGLSSLLSNLQPAPAVARRWDRTTVTDRDQVTNLLSAWQGGDESALAQLSPYIYRELHRLAARAMDGEAAGHTLQTTALVHEAFVRLVGADVDFSGRQHFFALAARMMRRILVDHARTRRRSKRGSGQVHLSLDAVEAGGGEDLSSVIELDEALGRLAEIDNRAADVIELIYFGGLSYEETAAALDISRTAVVEDLRFARAWLRKAMG